MSRRRWTCVLSWAGNLISWRSNVLECRRLARAWFRVYLQPCISTRLPYRVHAYLPDAHVNIKYKKHMKQELSQVGRPNAVLFLNIT